MFVVALVLMYNYATTMKTDGFKITLRFPEAMKQSDQSKYNSGNVWRLPQVCPYTSCTYLNNI